MKIIALDYDDTFTLDPAGWVAALEHLRKPHRPVWGVTARNRGQLIRCLDFHRVCDKILYCCGQSKMRLLTAHDIEVAYWIDDNPQYIHNSYPEWHGTPPLEDTGDDTLTPWLTEGGYTA
jgi:hypothetical protein